MSNFSTHNPQSSSIFNRAENSGAENDTLAESSGSFERTDNHVLADNRTAIDAAGDVCSAAGYDTAVLAPDIEAAAGDAGQVHTAVARSCLWTGEPFEPPVALLSGGECTVTVTGDGEGGPNQTFALSGAIELAAHDTGTEIVLGSVDTDGIDGPTDAAGALVDGKQFSDSAGREVHSTIPTHTRCSRPVMDSCGQDRRGQTSMTCG